MSTLIVEVCKIDAIEKHPNADRLSIATVKGWNCIVGLDQYKPGELVVFVPPDCIIPNDLIEKHELTYLKGHGRTGTVKLRGYISQGLILSLPDGKWRAGDDVAAAMGITKWAPPEPKYSIRGANQVSKKKMNPLFSKYTEIENIKNYPDIFKDGDMVVITEKIHGANFRAGMLDIFIDPHQPILYRLSSWWKKHILRQTHEFVYGSHNVQISYHNSRNSFYGDDVWGKIAKAFDLAHVIPPGFIVYGEVYGEGIQDLTYGRKGIDLAIFDIKKDGVYLDWIEVKRLCRDWNLPTVPQIYLGTYNQDCINLTDGKSLKYPEQIREGIVIKTATEANHPAIGRKILKSVSADYLTRKGATEYQ